MSADGETLVLELARAGQSIRVRYAQENWFEPVLMGENGLPVLPLDVTVQWENLSEG